MDSRILGRTLAVVTLALGLALPAAGQSSAQTKVGGLIHDYATSGGTDWQIVGDWSATLKGASGKVDVVISVSMERPNPASPGAHTHHVAILDGTVTAIANGYRITGVAAITSNGTTAGFSGSEVTVDVTGGPAVALAKVAVTFGGAAAGHFGDQPIEGVVSLK
jgi:hypothetical protein